MGIHSLFKKSDRHSNAGVCEKHSSGEEDRWEDEISEHHIRGWIAVSAARLHGQGWHKMYVLFTDAGDNNDDSDNERAAPRWHDLLLSWLYNAEYKYRHDYLSVQSLCLKSRWSPPSVIITTIAIISMMSIIISSSSSMNSIITSIITSTITISITIAITCVY